MDKNTLEICEKLLLSRVNHLDELQRISFDDVAVAIGQVKARYVIALCEIRVALCDHD